MRLIKGETSSCGCLYIVATPIGNLEDLTFRALRILGEVDVIACEDTRHTVKLLNKYGLKKKLVSHFQPREAHKIPAILGLMKKGKNIALVSDSGTPGISDPGFKLIREAIKEGIKIVPVPGASALTAALSASGLPTDRFLFIGFPPPKKEATRKMLLSLADERATLIFYLPSRRIQEFLQLITEVLGERSVVIARELTKVFEGFLRGSVRNLLSELKDKRLRGEVTLLVQGKPKRPGQTAFF